MCLLGSFPVLNGLSTLSMSEAHNKARGGTFLDILIPEEHARSCGIQAGLEELPSSTCSRCPDVTGHLIYSKLLEKKMEALFIKLWVYFLTERLLRSNTPSLLETYDGTLSV